MRAAPHLALLALCVAVAAAADEDGANSYPFDCDTQEKKDVDADAEAFFEWHCASRTSALARAVENTYGGSVEWHLRSRPFRDYEVHSFEGYISFVLPLAAYRRKKPTLTLAYTTTPEEPVMTEVEIEMNYNKHQRCAEFLKASPAHIKACITPCEDGEDGCFSGLMFHSIRLNATMETLAPGGGGEEMPATPEPTTAEPSAYVFEPETPEPALATPEPVGATPGEGSTPMGEGEGEGSTPMGEGEGEGSESSATPEPEVVSTPEPTTTPAPASEGEGEGVTPTTPAPSTDGGEEQPTTPTPEGEPATPKAEEGGEGEGGQVATPEPTLEATPEPTPAPTPEPTLEPTPEPVDSDSDRTPESTDHTAEPWSIGAWTSSPLDMYGTTGATGKSMNSAIFFVVVVVVGAILYMNKEKVREFAGLDEPQNDAPRGTEGEMHEIDTSGIDDPSASHVVPIDDASDHEDEAPRQKEKSKPRGLGGVRIIKPASKPSTPAPTAEPPRQDFAVLEDDDADDDIDMDGDDDWGASAPSSAAPAAPPPAQHHQAHNGSGLEDDEDEWGWGQDEPAAAPQPSVSPSRDAGASPASGGRPQFTRPKGKSD